MSLLADPRPSDRLWRRALAPRRDGLICAGFALLLGLATSVMAHGQPADEHYAAARLALAKGENARAKRELKLSLQEDPLRSPSHLLLALILAREKDLDQAVVGFKQTLTLDPNNAAAQYNLGTALLWRGEALAAARVFEDSLALRPDYLPTYINLAKAYFLAGLPELAIAAYREVLQRQESNALAQKNLILLTGMVNAGAPEALHPPALPRTTALLAAPTAPPPPAGPTPMTATLSAEGDPQVKAELNALRELLRDLKHVTVEWRGGRVTLSGWTSGTTERKLLEKILAAHPLVLDLTTDDVADSQRLLEVDAILFTVRGMDTQTAGHDFLRRVQVNFSVSDAAAASFNWLYAAAVSYEVNIANATEERIAFLARPHLTALSGSPATFIAGGDIVYKVAGTTSGDIKPYPFGTQLDVTPTLLRTPGPDGNPRVRLVVKAGRKSVLPLEALEAIAAGSSAFENISVTSEAILSLNQTLILTGLNQREHHTARAGVPGLRSVPIIKYLFSQKVTSVSDLAIIILLTPRDPGYWDEQNKQALEEFVAKRRAYMQAVKGTPEDMERFKQQYPDWNQLAPNRFASHFFLNANSDAYRRVSGVDLASEDMDFGLLGSPQKTKPKR